MKFTSHILTNDLPFQTVLRENSDDWLSLVIFFASLTFLVALIYRNPQVLSSLITRTFKSNADKLYFSSPAIDSVDRILLFLIYFSGSFLCLQFLELQQFTPHATWVLLTLPLFFVLYFVVPFYFVVFALGMHKNGIHLLRKQSALFFLFGLVLIMLGGFFFIDISSKWILQFIFMGLSLIVLILIHFRIFRELVSSGVSVYYIFIYFCTLEILPFAFLWVLISRF